VLQDGREIREGEHVESGGGEYAFEVDAMTHCRGNGLFMLNRTDEIGIRRSGG
jgi:hypothetical protein